MAAGEVWERATIGLALCTSSAEGRVEVGSLAPSTPTMAPLRPARR